MFVLPTSKPSFGHSFEEGGGISTNSDFNRPMADAPILEKCITFGPWGTNISFSAGKECIYIPDGFIKKIRILHGMCIDGIEFQSDSSTGARQKSFFGRQRGERTDMVTALI
ncbi:hypothetical protein Lser_V15G00704 [Lactuca serriola]